MKPLNKEEVVRKQKILQLANDVRKKYQALKLGRSEEDDTLNKIFTPITAPLKQLVEQKKLESKQELQPVKQQQKVRVPYKNVKSQDFENKRLQETKREVDFLPTYDVTSKDERDFEDIDDDDGNNYDSSLIDSGMVDDKYLSQYPDNVSEYVSNYLNDSPKIDVNQGPKYDPITSRWMLGSKIMDFNQKTGKLYIDKEEFNATSGLYNLIFYKEPGQYTNNDLDEYKRILEKTNVYRVGNTSVGRLKGNGGFKYTQLVKPLLGPESKIRSFSASSSFKGSGFDKMLYSEKPTEYVYWDDVNELVDRLRLLYASKQAGNTSHNNEILSIIEELREAKVIN